MEVEDGFHDLILGFALGVRDRLNALPEARAEGDAPGLLSFSYRHGARLQNPTTDYNP